MSDDAASPVRFFDPFKMPLPTMTSDEEWEKAFQAYRDGYRDVIFDPPRPLTAEELAWAQNVFELALKGYMPAVFEIYNEPWPPPRPPWWRPIARWRWRRCTRILNP